MMEELSQAEQERLIEKALEYRQRAYAPYSKFQVGAALLAADGSIYGGCNVENASYGLAICAERTAIASAIAAGQREFRAIAIVADTVEPTTPCGACRQFMVEFNPSMTVILTDLKKRPAVYRAKELLPEFFTMKD